MPEDPLGAGPRDGAPVLTSALPTGLVALASTLVVAGLAVTAVGAPEPASPAAGAGGERWVWPVAPPRVVRGFDAVGRYEAGHRGVDLAAAPGAPVVAVAAGSVTFAGQVAGRPVVVVAHAGGLRSTYEPVSADVVAGEAVRGGQRVGTLAAPAHCAGATSCLHLGLRAGEDYLDPLGWLRAAAPVLLPLGRP